MPSDPIRLAYDATVRDLVGLQLQILTFAMPIDLTFGSRPSAAHLGHKVRFETPFVLSEGDQNLVIDPGKYDSSVLALFRLLWQFVTVASVDPDWRLRLTFSSGTRLDVLPVEHLDWAIDDWFVCGP